MFYYLLIGALMAAVLLVLVLGVLNIMRSGDDASRTSNKLMMMRVGLQATVILLIGVLFLVQK